MTPLSEVVIHPLLEIWRLEITIKFIKYTIYHGPVYSQVPLLPDLDNKRGRRKKQNQQPPPCDANLMKISLKHVATLLEINISRFAVHLQVGCVWYQ